MRNRATKEQLKALKALYERTLAAPETVSFLQFRRRAMWEFGRGPKALLVNWCGMVVGIEPDGYTHS